MSQEEHTPTILLVEDDPGLGFAIQDTLREHGYRVHLSRDGMEGLKQFNQRAYDMCILDVMMPKKDGFELARDIRKVDSAVPIVFLSAKGMIEDKVRGFKSGADDYITKPFSSEELLLRVEAILRRSGTPKKEVEGRLYQLGSIRFDPDNFELVGPSGAKTLTRKEVSILKLLCERKNQVIERELLTTLIWGDDSYFVGRSLDVFITRLRKYLTDEPKVSITNVHGVGFKLELQP